MQNKTFYLESYGCSLNQAGGGAIAGLLKSRGYSRVESPEKASLILMNSCAVKTKTEHKMVRRLKELTAVSKELKSTLVVCGCLPKVNADALKDVSKNAILVGPSLDELASALGMDSPDSVLAVKEVSFSEFISIIPIAEGCLGKCAYCAVKNARGELKSHSPELIEAKFLEAVSQGKEIWITAQDSGCYGFDIETSLPELIQKLLALTNKKFRLRVGMMNPNHLEKFYGEYIALFDDPRLYKFFHIPIQSGSNRVLNAMNRQYSAKTALALCRKIRADIPKASIATDIIVGFPGESEEDFGETLDFVREIQPDVINVSKFGARPNTAAFFMKDQIHGGVMNKRSRVLLDLQGKASLARHMLFVGTEQEIFVSEQGSKGNFVGRTGGYKAVVVEQNLLGEFAVVKIDRAFATYSTGTVL